MKNSKIHFAILDIANESDTENYWHSIYCGMEYTESELTNDIKKVTCKKCLKRYNNTIREYVKKH